MPEDFGTLNVFERMILLESDRESYVGLQTIRIEYTMQDYLAGQAPLFTEFKVNVIPLPEIEFQNSLFAAKPQFENLTLEELSHTLKIGEYGTFDLPKPAEHELGYAVEYETVELNQAITFAEYLENLN